MPAGLVGTKHITSAQARPQHRNLSCVATTPPRAVYECIITGDDELPILSMHLEATAPAVSGWLVVEARATMSHHPRSAADAFFAAHSYGGRVRRRVLDDLPCRGPGQLSTGYRGECHARAGRWQERNEAHQRAACWQMFGEVPARRASDLLLVVDPDEVPSNRTLTLTLTLTLARTQTLTLTLTLTRSRRCRCCSRWRARAATRSTSCAPPGGPSRMMFASHRSVDARRSTPWRLPTRHHGPGDTWFCLLAQYQLSTLFTCIPNLTNSTTDLCKGASRSSPRMARGAAFGRR